MGITTPGIYRTDIAFFDIPGGIYQTDIYQIEIEQVFY